MEVTDLMIGDWLQYYDCNLKKQCYAQVTSIQADGTEPYIQTSDSDVYYLVETYKPIPITSEILEKNGFEGEGYAILKLDSNSWLEYYYHEHRLRKYWSGIDEWQNHSEVKDLTFQCHCYYVHELQHVLHLCGIEKKIIL